MVSVNVYKAKTRLSHYLDLVAKGEKVVLCRRNVPIAEIRKFNSKPKRVLGLCKERFEIPAIFFEPLPDNILKRFRNPL